MEEGKHSGKERRYKYPGERIFNAEYLFTWGEEANSQTLCVGFLKGDGPIFRKAKRRKNEFIGSEEKLGPISLMWYFGC